MNKQKIHSAIKITVLVCKCKTATADHDEWLFVSKCGCVVADLSAWQWVSAQICTYTYFFILSINLWISLVGPYQTLWSGI